MKKTFTFFLIFFTSFTVQADQTLVIENIWIREAPPTVKVLAGYMTLKNPTDQDITLSCAESPAFEDVMFHKTEISDGIAKMRHAEEIVIPAHSSFELTPGDHHLMLVGRKELLKEGDKVNIKLIFKNIDDHNVSAMVKKTISE